MNGQKILNASVVSVVSIASISVLTAAVLAGCSSSSSSSATSAPSHVLLISLDGLHQQDLTNCLANKTCPNIAALANTGVNYTGAITPAISDSFPGLAALLTGATPKTAGLFYDVSYDRTLYAPSDNTCTGPQGWNVVFDETAGIDGWNGNPLVHLNGGGGFNPDAIPHAMVSGNCVPVYPHNYIKTNTVFEVVKQNMAGSRTAWADKHAWAYDWVNGPSGTGVDDLARTEINSINPASPTGKDYTDLYTNTEIFDKFHTQIVLNQIDGKDSTGTDLAPVPTIFGTNYQTLSVAQKALNGSGGGYIDASFTPGPAVAAAIAFVDGEIGKMVTELKAKNLYNSTLVIITAKHGQSPSDHTKLVKNGDTLTALLQSKGYLPASFGQFNTTTGSLNDGSGLAGTGIVQTDDVGLIWLQNPASAVAAVADLKANLSCVTASGICADSSQAYILSAASGVISGTGTLFDGTGLIARFGDPASGRTPDIIVQPNPGVIYTSSTKKDAEHGGNAPDDRHVGLLVSYPSLSASTNSTAVVTTQVAPTILQALGGSSLVSKLNAVTVEGTAILPGLPF